MSYRDVKYYLKESTKLHLKSQNKKKLFDLRYVFLRNVIERQFNILKQHFKIIRIALEFSLSI